MSGRAKAVLALLIYIAAMDLSLRIDAFSCKGSGNKAAGVVMPSRPPCSPGVCV